MDTQSAALVWFRQDLRLADQAALAAAAAEGPVAALYVLDEETPGRWAIGAAQRWWLHHALAVLAKALRRHGVTLILRRGRAAETVAAVAVAIGAKRVHAIRHYEPWWQAAEAELDGSVALCLHDGNHLADPRTILTGSGGRYRMFTPFWRTLRDRLPPAHPRPVPKIRAWTERIDSDELDDWGLRPAAPDWAAGFAEWTPGEDGAAAALADFADRAATYGHDRDLPSIAGTSRLSPHLHFGEISPATIWHGLARRSAEPFLRELAWRDFAANVIDVRPDYGARNGRAAYDRFPWRQSAGDLRAWQRGRTGYPIVDAGMRQLWATGWMHNRVRMIAASFLVKHLLIDWRAGERWFWDTLVDADYGNNSVNWQWVAGTGDDSSPFGRIMAPLAQSSKFGAGDYIRRWVPELAGIGDDAIHDPHDSGVAPAAYPPKLIGHREARARALDAAGAIRAG